MCLPWGLMRSWVVTSVPAQGCLAMEPCPGDLGLVLDTLGPLQPFLVPDPSSHAAGVCSPADSELCLPVPTL